MQAMRLKYYYSHSRLFLFAGQGTQEKGMFQNIDKSVWQKIF